MVSCSLQCSFVVGLASPCELPFRVKFPVVLKKNRNSFAEDKEDFDNSFVQLIAVTQGFLEQLSSRGGRIVDLYLTTRCQCKCCYHRFNRVER